MAPILNVGIVGTGTFARHMHLPCYEALPDDFKVVAANNRTKSKALDFAKVAGIPESKVYDDLDGILNDKDVDYIDAMLPVEFNLPTVKKAIAAKKPIILEKPIAATIEQARELVKVAEATDIPVGIAENWLFYQVIDVAKKHLPRIGKVVAFIHNSTAPCSTDNKYHSTNWRLHPKHIGGILSDGGVHQLGLLTSLVGEFDTVSALTSKVHEQSATDEIAFSTVTMRDSDVIGSFNYGTDFGATEPSIYVKIFGKKGTVMVDLSNKKKPVVKVRIGETAEKAGEEEVYPVEYDRSYGVKDEFLNFHEAVVKKDKSLYRGTPRRTFHHLAVIAAILESSSKHGNAVKVEQP